MIDEEGQKHLHRTLMEGIHNQIRENNPPETEATLERLLAEGFSKNEAMNLIGHVLAAEIFEVMKYQREYDQEKYVSRLHDLPQLPED
ncbi:MAG: hypothetical protein ACRD9Y_09355 [Blastocatellia bacterium]